MEAQYGKVWSTQELSQDFEVLGFMAPLVVVRRKADGVRGSLEFQHSPRFYFNFKKERENLAKNQTNFTSAVTLIIGIIAGYLFHRYQSDRLLKNQQDKADNILRVANEQARLIETQARENAVKIVSAAEAEIKERRIEVNRETDRLDKRRTELDGRAERLEQREQALNKRQSTVDRRANEIDKMHAEESTRLEEIARMTPDEAKKELFAAVEKEARGDMARIIRQIEAEAREEGEKRARKLIADAIQRVASEHVAEVTRAVVTLPNEEMKGRIVGRNGRNIKAFEQAAGVDVIVDDTPDSVTVSCFDSVRREIGRRALGRLIQDGRIHPARIEETVEKVTKEVEKDIREAGEQACFELGITGLHPEHIEAHGSYEEYRAAKRILFDACRNFHIINADDKEHEFFGAVPANKKIFYGIDSGDLRASDLEVQADTIAFNVYGTGFRLGIGGRFNVYNALAALAVGAMYGVDLPTAQPVLAGISGIPGRLQWIQKEPFGFVVDYAHTPDSLEAVYSTLKSSLGGGKLICILGAAGGGRDRWKRKEFGRLAQKYADRIILTDEDPFDEDPMAILRDIQEGMDEDTRTAKLRVILDRKAAIAAAIAQAGKDDIVVITGKGSETSMALAGGRKIPWSDADTAGALLKK